MNRNGADRIQSSEIRYDDKSLARYAWDHRDRLVQVVVDGEPTVYSYDYRNRLVRRNDEIFVHDGWQVVWTLKAGKIVDRYLWGAKQDELLCENNEWMLGDHLNTVRAIVKNGECVHKRLKYNAFGELLNEPDDEIAFAYTGKLFDAKTGLQWNINRWYDPKVGRWISEDPIGFEGKDWNLVRYVKNRPTMSNDPLGLWKSNVHSGKTFDWCVVSGYKMVACRAIADADDGTDYINSGTSPFPAIGDQSYHFNRNFPPSVTDSRLAHLQDRIQKAKRLCQAFPLHRGMTEIAAKHFGIGLHALQDYYAHGDYGRLEWPDIWIPHNFYGSTVPGATSVVRDYPDDPALDASGDPVGRPAGAAILTTYVFDLFYQEFRDVDYANYIFGTKRITATENRTKSELLDFYNFLNRDPTLCECRKYFTFL